MEDMDKTATGVLEPLEDTQTMPAEGATQMAMNVDCPVCHTPNPPSETYCIDCGFLLGSEPIGVEQMPEQPPMGKLITPDGTREFALNAGPNTVGRENADILLSHNTVSRKHATITVHDHRAYLEDAGSTNGTTVDGVKVAPGEKADLTDGCEIVFGSFALKYQAPEGAEPEQPEPAEEAQPEAETREPESAEPSAEAQETPEKTPVESVGRLVSKDGAYTFDIHDGTNTVGRRAADNDIVIPDPYCSGRHADLTAAEGKFTITDVGSTNGTFVNGVKLDAHAPRELADGDEVTLGRTVFTIAAV
jgi:pSer/pThr/pTyr-binding forkhead associated (FHA) protein